MTFRCALRETKGRSSAMKALRGLLGRTRMMALTFLRKGRDRREYALQPAHHTRLSPEGLRPTLGTLPAPSSSCGKVPCSHENSVTRAHGRA